jgi:CheY-like chemotaxis protein
MTISVSEGATDPLPAIVLLVEDDRDTLDMYSSYLESAGLWVATATSPSEGQAHARELRPNLLVTDIRFGGEPTGINLVHAIKQDGQTAHIPILVLSGTSVEELPPETQREADLVLLKPGDAGRVAGPRSGADEGQRDAPRTRQCGARARLLAAGPEPRRTAAWTGVH